MQNLSIEISDNQPVFEQVVEIVERKGTGHPDYICDAVMERISIALSREYIRRFGYVLHHNIDKGFLVAGQAEKKFGGGRVLKPMEFIIGDRATFKVGRNSVPVIEIAKESVDRWFEENLRHVNIKKDIKVRIVLRPGSVQLESIFKKDSGLLGANDTSATVGYAPLTATEKAVLDTERFVNSSAFKTRFPESGEDVKVMGIRKNDELDLVLACPLISKYIKSEKDYFKKKHDVYSEVMSFVSKFPFGKISLNFNTLDKKGQNAEGVYLSLLGTSAEDADSGQVGRGNRVNGVISLNRPMGTEAAAGKNPVSHVGKIYSVLSHRIANEIYKRIPEIKEVYVWLLSSIGSPIDRPKQVYIKILQNRHFDKKAALKGINTILEEFLSGIEAFTGELSRGEYPVC